MKRATCSANIKVAALLPRPLRTWRTNPSQSGDVGFGVTTVTSVTAVTKATAVAMPGAVAEAIGATTHTLSVTVGTLVTAVTAHAKNQVTLGPYGVRTGIL